MKDKDWYTVNNTNDIITPSLLVYPNRIEENIRNMIKIAGGIEFLRPHIKTYKMAEIIKLQLKHGIYKFKCATITEAELLAESGALDVLLAMQPVGANIHRFFNLIASYPSVEFSTLVDNHKTLKEINDTAIQYKVIVSLYLDVNNGMDRTGIRPGKTALDVYRDMVSSSNIIAKGLHVYDGHIRESNFDKRKKICDVAFELVTQLKSELENAGLEVSTVIAGGTPSFPIHALREGVVVSPGTPLLWDQGYANLFPELPFLPAAVLLSRLVSKPNTNLLCFDLGHKSVASEMQFPRVQFLNLPDSKQISHSEEHLVVDCNDADQHQPGDLAYAIPVHVCPTVSKYKEVLTVSNRTITDTWRIAARDH